MDKILIVEDEEEIAWGLSSVLKNRDTRPFSGTEEEALGIS